MKKLYLFLLISIITLGAQAQNWEIELLVDQEGIPLFGSFYDLDGDLDLDHIHFSSIQDMMVVPNLNGVSYGLSQMIIDLEFLDFTSDILFADIDNDGDLDILRTSSEPENVKWYPNFGDFDFGEELIIYDPLGNGEAIKFEDMDNDDDLDLVLSSSGQGLFWMENITETGLWEFHLINFSTLSAPDIRFEDVDGDGDNDAFITFNQWIENEGDNNFSDLAVFESPMNVPGIQFYAFEDLDGDTDLDIIYSISNQFDDVYGFYWAENDGAGGFESEQLITAVEALDKAVFEDFDNDGDPDIIYHALNNDGIPSFFYIENNSDGTFEESVFLVEANMNIWKSEGKDINGDGYMDFIFVNQDNSTTYWCKNGFFGCMDSSACNYSADAINDDGSCCYGICGCLDPFAKNYNSTADCENESCLYDLQGIVFFDENENGIQDVEDYPLSNQEVFIESQGITSLSNAEGEFIFNNLSLGNYSIEAVPSDLFPFVYPSLIQVASIVYNEETEPISFGMSNDLLEFEIGVSQYSNVVGSLCGDWMEYIITYQNLGNATIDGTVDFTYSELYQDYAEITPIASVDGNTLTYTFQELQPGESRNIYLDLLTPSVESIGETVISTVNTTGFYDEEPTAYGFSTIEDIVTCAYDPNDKQVFPAGVTDEHYIFDDQELEYLVRFQNTGNAPATTVLISDTIDENLNLDSFELVGYSHPVNVSIHADTRIVDFLFAEIMLPDSVNNEPESHGFVSYKITPLEDAPLLTEINNTAYIYFDNNEAVVTNTTWSTLYDCSLFEAEITEGDASLFASEGVAYQWYLDGEIIEGAIEQIFTPSQNGNYSVEVENMMGCMLLTEEVVYDIISVEEYLKSPFKLYPNPMTQSTTLDLGSTDGYSVSIYSVDGRVVRDYGRVFTNQLEMVKGDLKAGHYSIGILDVHENILHRISLIIN